MDAIIYARAAVGTIAWVMLRGEREHRAWCEYVWCDR